MTDQSNVFNNTNTSQGDPQPTPPSNTSLFTDQLASITNEDGTQKYNTVEDALKGTKHAQEYIPQLKSQLSEKEAEVIALKAKLESQGTLEDVVSRLTEQPKTPEAESQPAPTATLTEESVMQLINNNKAKEQADLNEQAVSASLAEKYGDKAPEMLQAKANELGSTVQELQKIARNNPTMVMSFFQTKPIQVNNPTPSSMNVPPSSGEQAPARPKALDLLKGTNNEASDAFKGSMAATLKRLGVQE